MVLPEPFTTASPFVVSVASSDILTGLGYEPFYFMVSNHGGAGQQFVLTPSSDFFSWEKEKTESTTITRTFTSSTFNIPRTIKGDAICNIGLAATATGSNETVAVQLFKWDGTSATAITSQITVPVVTGVAMLYTNMPCTETLIAEGEMVRMVVVFTIDGGGESITWGHDPAGRAGALVATTSSRINIPFKFDG